MPPARNRPYRVERRRRIRPRRLPGAQVRFPGARPRSGCALLSFCHHISPAWRNGRAAPISCVGGRLAQVHERERQLTREVSQTVEQALSGVEVLAVQLAGPERFTVFIDHPSGVDHALCARVTELLRGYLDRYTVDVSSPGIERPLRTPAHFRNVVGRKVVIRTETDIAGRKRFRGTVADCRRHPPGSRRRGRRARDYPVRRDRAGQPRRRRRALR